MTTTDQIVHYGVWSSNVVYYVQCKDNYGNLGNRIMVSPYFSSGILY